LLKKVFFKPYNTDSSNLAYNRLFCDDIKLYKDTEHDFPGDAWQRLLQKRLTQKSASQLASEQNLPARLRILAFNYLLAKGSLPSKKELLGVIVEAGIETGLETLAVYTDKSLVYINEEGTGRELQAGERELPERFLRFFAASAALGEQLQPSPLTRFPAVFPGMARITLLISDGRYFGQGPSNVLSKDKMSGPIIRQAADLLTELIKLNKMSH
jgi:hypothetical protein